MSQSKYKEMAQNDLTNSDKQAFSLSKCKPIG